MNASAEARLVVDPVCWPRLVEVLDALSPVEHRAVAAVYFEGRTFRETAELLAVDVRAVSRAIAAVRRPVADHVIAGGDA